MENQEQTEKYYAMKLVLILIAMPVLVSTLSWIARMSGMGWFGVFAALALLAVVSFFSTKFLFKQRTMSVYIKSAALFFFYALAAPVVMFMATFRFDASYFDLSSLFIVALALSSWILCIHQILSVEKKHSLIYNAWLVISIVVVFFSIASSVLMIPNLFLSINRGAFGVTETITTGDKLLIPPAEF